MAHALAVGGKLSSRATGFIARCAAALTAHTLQQGSVRTDTVQTTRSSAHFKDMTHMSQTHLDRFDTAEGFGGKVAIVIDLATALNTNLVAAADSDDEDIRDRTVDAALSLAQDLVEMIECLPVGVGYREDAYLASPYFDSEEWED